MADHVIVHTSEPGSEVVPRVSTELRGGDITPDGDNSAGPSGDHLVPEPASVGTGPTGDHLEAPVPASELVPAIATRRNPESEPTGTNPLT